MDRTQAFNSRLQTYGYEIWFGTAFDFEQEVAVWFRYSTLLRRNASPVSAIWFSFFDQRTGESTVRTRGIGKKIEQTGKDYLLDTSTFSQERVSGTLGDVSWNLACSHKFDAESHVSESLMNSRLVKTKSIVVSPFCNYYGSIRVANGELKINGDGCYTHIWGTQRVPELYWCFVPRFDDADVGLEFFAVRPKPFLPIAKFITIREGGNLIHQHSLWRSITANLTPKFPEFSSSGGIDNGTFDLQCRMAEPATPYIYVDPSGSNRFINQNDSSSARLVLERDGQRQELISQHRAAVEFHGMKPWGEYEYANPYAMQ